MSHLCYLNFWQPFLWQQRKGTKGKQRGESDKNLHNVLLFFECSAFVQRLQHACHIASLLSLRVQYFAELSRAYGEIVYGINTSQATQRNAFG